jgi:hypothetical protein
MNPQTSVLELCFGHMTRAIALSLSAPLSAKRSLSIVCLALALFEFGLSVYQLRSLPPPRR